MRKAFLFLQCEVFFQLNSFDAKVETRRGAIQWPFWVCLLPPCAIRKFNRIFLVSNTIYFTSLRLSKINRMRIEVVFTARLKLHVVLETNCNSDLRFEHFLPALNAGNLNLKDRWNNSRQWHTINPEKTCNFSRTINNRRILRLRTSMWMFERQKRLCESLPSLLWQRSLATMLTIHKYI
jgi:hypothetical protein